MCIELLHRVTVYSTNTNDRIIFCAIVFTCYLLLKRVQLNLRCVIIAGSIKINQSSTQNYNSQDLLVLMPAIRKIVHIDMDAFYASVEQLDHPHFRGKPLIVGGKPGGRGVVAACSYEARRFGIHSAMPCSRAAKLCPSAIFTPPRIGRYKEVSSVVMKVFREYTDLVEPLSLDEAFLDVTTNFKDESSATKIANSIRRQIYRTTHLTASAGISFNKFLAKVASDYNKPDGSTTIDPEQYQAFIKKLTIRKFFGVGKVTEKKMLRLGIKTGADLLKWEKESLIFHFGKAGTFLYDIVRGIDDRPVMPQRNRKSIGNETTLSSDTTDLLEINVILNTLAIKVASILQVKNTGGYTLTLKIRYSDFETISRSITLTSPLYSIEEIENQIPRLLRATQAGSRPIRLVGLSISKLTGNKKVPRQLMLPFPDLEK